MKPLGDANHGGDGTHRCCSNPGPVGVQAWADLRADQGFAMFRAENQMNEDFG
jgi:hypothetical protein